jgi:alpha-mannosidase
LTDDSACFTLFNTLSFTRRDPAVIETQRFARDYPSQRYTDVCGRDVLAVGGLELAGFGSAVLELCDAPKALPSPFIYDGTTLTTPYARLTFDENGYIASYIDLATNRELRKHGGEPLGVFLFGEDVPHLYDNWDVDRNTIQNLKPVRGFKGRTLVTDGAVEIRLRSTFDVGDGTTLVQDMVCYADTPRIDFHTRVDWQSPHRLLKVGFDLDVAASRARCEIQYGAIERPTTENNSYELAKFEVCNRNYTDISEPRFGAAVLNDCKYGISVTNCNLRLSLHRGGTRPNVTGDCGVHEMTYSLFVHDGGFCAESVVHPAYEVNIPIVAAAGKAELPPFAEIDAPNVIVESVKPAEDDSDAFVLRLYECEGSRTTTEVCLSEPVKDVLLTNMLEDVREPVDIADNRFFLSFRPFEIKTVKCVRT